MQLAKQTKESNVTRQLFEQPWNQNSTPAEAHKASLLLLASLLGRDLTGMATTAYLAILADFSKDQSIEAFSLALEECEFFPPPAKLRALANIPTSGQLAREEALAALGQVLTAMRGRHGWTLKGLNGKLIDKDEHGNNLDRAYREPPIPAPTFSSEIESAIVYVGLGERSDGLRALSMILSGPDTSESATWHAGEVRRLEQRWMEAYARAKGKANG